MTHTLRKLIKHLCSLDKAHHSVLVLTNPDSPSALCLGAISNSEIGQKCKKCSINYAMKRTLRVQEMKQGTALLCITSAENVGGQGPQLFTILYVSK